MRVLDLGSGSLNYAVLIPPCQVMTPGLHGQENAPTQTRLQGQEIVLNFAFEIRRGWHGLLLLGTGPARRAAEEPKRSQCNAQSCRAAQRQCVWHEMAAASCRAADPDTNYDATADAAVPHPELEVTPPGWCRWSVQSNKVQHVAPQLIHLPRSYICAPLPNKWRFGSKILRELPTQVPDPRTLFPLFRLGSRLPTQETKEPPRLPTLGPRVGR